MKKSIVSARWLSMLLACIVLLSSLPVSVLSEESEVLEPILAESEQTELLGSEVDASRDASYSPAFLTGYAEVLEDSVVSGAGLPAGTIVYVYDRDLNDVLSICVASGDGAVLGTLPATVLRPLSGSESEILSETLTAADIVSWFDAEQTIALPILPGSTVEVSEVPAEQSVETEPQAETEAEGTEEAQATAEPVEEIIALDEEREPSAQTDDSDEAAQEPDTAEAVQEPAEPVATAEPIPQLSEKTTEAEEEAAAEAEDEVLSVSDEEMPAAEETIEARKLTDYEDVLVVEVGKTLQGEKVTGAFWTSEDTSVATISDTGLLTGIAAGSTHIIETLPNGDQKRWPVNVTQPITEIDLNTGSLKLGLKEEYQLKAGYLGEDITALVNWTSSNPKIAAVDSTGKVSTLRVGKVVITAEKDGRTAKCEVQVFRAPYSVVPSPKTALIGVGEELQLGCTFSTGTWSNVMTYSTDVASVVKVTEQGVVTGIGTGTAKVTMTAYNGKTGVCTITVAPKPEMIALDATELRMGVGQSATLKPILLPEGSVSTLTWSSEDPTCAAVNNSGKIVAAAPGETNIWVSAFNGKKVKCHVIVKNAPESIALEDTVLKLGVGEEHQVRAILPFDTATKLTWTSSSRIIELSDTGYIKALRIGTVKVTAKTHNGKTASMTVQVLRAPTSVSLSPETKELGVGETATLTLVYPKNTYSSAVTWSSDDSSIATVDATTGLITAKRVGSVRIMVTTAGGLTASAMIAVKQAPTSVEFSEKELKLGVGQTYRVQAELSPNSVAKIDYGTASSGTVAKVDETGLVKGIKVGSDVVTAGVYNGLVGVLPVTVVAAPKKINVNQTSVTLGVGESFALTAQTDSGAEGLTWATSSAKCVTVDQDGNIQAKAVGSTYITITAYNRVKASVRVTVKAAPTAVTLDPTSMKLGVGESSDLAVTVLPKGSAAHGTFESSNTSVATVTDAGHVVAIAPGTATITATAYNGVNASCTVQVLKAPSSLNLDTFGFELGAGETKQVTASFNSGEYSSLEWSSSDTAVATVDQNGLVTAKKYGTAKISVEALANGVKATVTVNVWNAPSSVSLKEASATIDLNATYQLEPTIPSDSRTTFTYTSKDPTIATVSSTGLVKGIKYGTTEVGVKTANGKTAVMTLKVFDKYCPVSVTINNIKTALEPDETLALTATVQPSTAIPELKWSSSNTAVATISESGLVTAKATGVTVIQVISNRNSACSDKFTLYVQTNETVLSLPSWTTAVSGTAILSNTAAQEKIKNCAYAQIEFMNKAGIITSSDASKRKSMIGRAFTDLEFPWITPALQKYWNANNSEGGVKDFKTGTMYYGMPYTMNSDTRRYCVSKALSEKRWTKTGSYYTLNRSNLLSGRYCGNDCSAFVSQAIWGADQTYSYMTTSSIAKSINYKSISYDALRPGDLLNWGGHHVVMFLYWADEAHTAMMIIENGGTPKGTNTVHCAIYKADYYQDNGYIPKRLASLGFD